MKLIDKIFAWYSIPVGGLLLIFGVISMVTGFEFHIYGGFLQGLAIAVLGWSLCISLARSWRMTNRYEDLAFQEVMESEEFGSFMEKHPEYLEASVRTKRKVFRLWQADKLESASQTVGEG